MTAASKETGVFILSSSLRLEFVRFSWFDKSVDEILVSFLNSSTLIENTEVQRFSYILKSYLEFT